MNKKIAVLVGFLLLAGFAAAQISQPKTQKMKVPGRENAYLYMTERYRSDSWAEFYFVYEENKNTYKEAETEKIMYEFFANYKRDNGYSAFESEDLQGTAVGDKTTTMKKRVVFKHVNKR
ncbi:MAG: hypothetical protein ACTTH7_05795 [Treponema sp.]